MAQATSSYTIYIRYPNEQTNNKCKPRQEENNNTKPIDLPSGGGSSGGSGGGSSGGGGSFNPWKVARAVKNPMGALLGAATKVLPAVAGVVAVAKITDNVVSAVLPFYEGYSGDYTIGINYANVKNSIGAIMNPFGTLINYQRVQMETYRANLVVEQQRMLTGNSIINTYGGKASN